MLERCFHRRASYFSTASRPRDPDHFTFMSYSQVISVDTPESLSSVLLSLETKGNRVACVFGVCEGLQRICSSHKVGITNMEHIFLTDLDASSVSGTCGIWLTATSGMTQGEEGSRPLPTSQRANDAIKIYGPQGLNDAYRFMRRFTRMKLSNLVELKGRHFPLASSGPRLAKPGESQQAVSPPVDIPGAFRVAIDNHFTLQVVPIIVGDGKGKSDVNTERPRKRRKSAPVDRKIVSYMCHLPQRRGKFQVEKAVALGVEEGKNFGLLTQGKSVRSMTGEWVHPVDCVSEPDPSAIIGILSCPNEATFEALKSSSAMQRYFTSSPDHYKTQCLYHRTPQSIVQTDAYKAFCDAFGEDVHHVILNKETSQRPTAFPQASAVHHHLSMLAPDIFMPGPDMISKTESVLRRGIPGQILERFKLSPLRSVGPERTWCPPPLNVSLDTAWRSHFASHSVIKAFDNSADQGCDEKPSDCDVLFLGTGSMQPAQYRNVSAILARTSQGAALLDCGEGTLGQLNRYFGESAASRLLCEDLSVIWTSHFHADHFLGLFFILEKRSQCTNGAKPIVVVGCSKLRNALDAYERQINPAIKRGVTFHLHHDADQGKAWESIGISSKSVPVNHMRHAHGIVLSGDKADGGTWKIVYSGDTEPCAALAKAGDNADMLIHEATVDTGLYDEARMKRHSTISEAVEMGLKMNARATILTHWSQRYPFVCVKEVAHALEFAAVSEDEIMVIPSFDFMQISVNEASGQSPRLKALPKAMNLVVTAAQRGASWEKRKKSKKHQFSDMHFDQIGDFIADAQSE